jgi:hypothetical protein
VTHETGRLAGEAKDDGGGVVGAGCAKVVELKVDQVVAVVAIEDEEAIDAVAPSIVVFSEVRK